MRTVPRALRPTWSWWRAALGALGILLWLATVVQPPRSFPRLDWIGGAELGVCSVAASALVLLGAPRLEHPVQPSRRPGVRVLRLLAHPLMAGLLNCLVLVWVFSSGWYDRAVGSVAGWALLTGFVLAMGVFAGAGTLVPGLLPGIGPGLQVLFAGVASGLAQVPAIAAMVLHHHGPGVGMWLVTQPVVIPVLGVLVARWVSRDREQAFLTDARLDAEEAERRGW